MNRRFEMGPLLVALGALLLLVSLFLDWYGPLTAWDAFEVADVLLAVLGVLSLVGGLGALAPDSPVVERRWLPAIVLAAAVLVIAEIIDPPPAAADLAPDTGAWIAFAAAIVMLIGAVLSLGRVSISVSVAEREYRQRVAAVDERQETTETGAVVAPSPASAPAAEEPTAATVPDSAPPGTRASRRAKR